MSKGTVNRVTLVGRLGQDPEIKYAASGTAIASMSLATVDSVKDGDSFKDITEWHRLVVFGKQAEFCGKYLAKGASVYVEGSIRTNNWEDGQGNKRSTVQIVVRDIQMIGGKSNGSSGTGSGASNQGGQQQSGGSKSSGGGGKFDPMDMGDDPPF